MAAIVPPPLQLNRFSTEEVEDIWLDCENAMDNAFDSTDFTLSNPATPVFNTNTPIVDRDDWLSNKGFLKLEPHIITATPVELNSSDENGHLCSAAPINFGFPVFDEVEAEASSGSAPTSPLPCDNKKEIALMEAMDKAVEDNDIESEEEAPCKRIRLKMKPEIQVKQENNTTTNSTPAPAPKSRHLQRETRSKYLSISVVEVNEYTAKPNPKPKKETKRRRARNGRNKSLTKPGVAVTAAQKREERLRRNRESANRSRIRKKQEMGNLRSEVANLRGQVHKLNTQILELEKENDSLQNQLADFKSPNSAVRPAMAVFALVFTVAFYAQPTTDYTALAASHGSPPINTKVWSQDPHHVPVAGFFLAPALELLPNSVLNAESLDILPIIVDVVTKLFVALVIASISGLVFHYTFKWFQQRKSSVITQRTNELFQSSGSHPSKLESDRIRLLHTV